MSDLVSIYMPTKNRVSLLQRAVSSVLGQTVRNIELIIVSDGSNDGTCEYVRSINSDIRVVLIENKTSAGACVSRNQAIEKASGKFVTGLDDDDFFIPDRIEKFKKKWTELEDAGVNFSCLFDTRIVDDGINVFLSNKATGATYEEIIRTNLIGNQVFTKRERLIAVGAYDTNMPAWQDWDLWVRLLKRYGQSINIKQNTYYFDISHEFERITNKSPDQIKIAAVLFFKKNCTQKNMRDILMVMAEYPQMTFTLNDLFQLIKNRQFRFLLRKIRYGQYIKSFSSSLPVGD